MTSVVVSIIGRSHWRISHVCWGPDLAGQRIQRRRAERPPLCLKESHNLDGIPAQFVSKNFSGVNLMAKGVNYFSFLDMPYVNRIKGVCQMEQGSSTVKPGDAFLAKPAVIAFNDFEAEGGGHVSERLGYHGDIFAMTWRSGLFKNHFCCEQFQHDVEGFHAAMRVGGLKQTATNHLEQPSPGWPKISAGDWGYKCVIDFQPAAWPRCWLEDSSTFGQRLDFDVESAHVCTIYTIL